MTKVILLWTIFYGGRGTSTERDWPSLEACKSAAQAHIENLEGLHVSGYSWSCLNAETGKTMARQKPRSP